MASIHIRGDELIVALTSGEKLAGLHRDIAVPLSAVRHVVVEPDALAAARGLRAPGLQIPGRTKIGTWRRRGHRGFVVARRGTPAVRVRLDGVKYDELLVSTPRAQEVAAAIRTRSNVPEVGAPASRENEVTLTSDGLVLAGTFTVPVGDGPHPAALLLPGSGEIDRDAYHRRFPFWLGRDLARALSDAGVASLRYDKRGVGASQGDWLAAGLHDNVADARAALSWLRSRPEVDHRASFVIGHSEGALLAAALGGDPVMDDIAGVVLLSAAAKTGEETLAWQTRQIAPGLPAPVRMLLRLLRIDIVDKQRKNVAKLRATTSDIARIDGRRINARWHRELLDFDPKPPLARLRAPVLAITGDKDIQVDPADLEVIANTVPAPVETVRVPDLTHLLRRDPAAPTLGAYKRLVRQPLDPEVQKLVTGWISRVAHRDAAGDVTT